MRFFSLIICMILSGMIMHADVGAQSNDYNELYIDYKKYLEEAFKLLSSDKPLSAKNAQELRDSALYLADEAAPGTHIRILPGNKKLMKDEDVFLRRKNSVYIFGKLLKRKPNGNVDFELTGTAFAIDEDGICATNYHVLQDIIQKKEQENNTDSIYFIMTSDKNIFIFDKVLAYSRNNDFAIFKVNTRSEKLQAIPFGKPARVGATAYCISHPGGYFYYLSKGIVARNVVVTGEQAAAGFNPKGKPPVRMEITADYGIGSSGGPILDQYGNLIGIVSSTIAVNSDPVNSIIPGHQQMVIKDAVPVIAITELLIIKR